MRGINANQDGLTATYASSMALAKWPRAPVWAKNQSSCKHVMTSSAFKFEENCIVQSNARQSENAMCKPIAFHGRETLQPRLGSLLATGAVKKAVAVNER